MTLAFSDEVGLPKVVGHKVPRSVYGFPGAGALQPFCFKKGLGKRLCIKSRYSQALLEQLPLLYQKSRRLAQAPIHILTG